MGVAAWQLDLQQAQSSTGALSSALGAASVTSTGTVADAGAEASTLGALTSSATGTVAVAASLSLALSTVTDASAGTVAISGASAPTLGAASEASAGTVSVAGSAADSLTAASMASAGAVSIDAAAARSLSTATQSAQGGVSVSGSSDGALSAASVSSSGAVSDQGTEAGTLAAASTISAGQLAVSGQCSAQLQPVVLDSYSGEEQYAHVAVQLDAAVIASGGTVSDQVVQQLSTPLSALGGSWQNVRPPLPPAEETAGEVSGEANITLGAMTASASGSAPARVDAVPVVAVVACPLPLPTTPARESLRWDVREAVRRGDAVGRLDEVKLTASGARSRVFPLAPRVRPVPLKRRA